MLARLGEHIAVAVNARVKLMPVRRSSASPGISSCSQAGSAGQCWGARCWSVISRTRFGGRSAIGADPNSAAPLGAANAVAAHTMVAVRALPGHAPSAARPRAALSRAPGHLRRRDGARGRGPGRRSDRPRGRARRAGALRFAACSRHSTARRSRRSASVPRRAPSGSRSRGPPARAGPGPGEDHLPRPELP